MNPIILLLTTIIPILALSMTSSYAPTATAAAATATTTKGYTHPTLSPPIATSTTELTYESLRNAQMQLHANTASVHSYS